VPPNFTAVPGPTVLALVERQGLEDVVAKRKRLESQYEPVHHIQQTAA
jgi:hypothetical protein